MENFNYKKSLGQNFLQDVNILSNIVKVADIKENSLVVEVGPGSGNLTKEIAKVATRVLCYEIDERLENIRVHWIASEIYQAIKRVNRNMVHTTDVIIFLNNEKIISLIQEQMKNSCLEVNDYQIDMFQIEKNKQDEYVDTLKKESYATKFIVLLAEIQNGMHSEMLDSNNRISKIRAREYLGIKTSGNFSNKVLNKSEVIFYCQTRNIRLDGQYIKLPKTG